MPLARSVTLSQVISCLRAVLFTSLAFVTAVASDSSAQSPKDPFGQHLAAGEFGPALQIANRVNQPGQRDQMLRNVAEAQARAGAQFASLGTASSISQDTARSEAFESLAGQPFFGSGARGGAALADFDTLIQLITQTIAPDSWVDAGGPGAVEAFPGGVYVDSSGMLRRVQPAPDAVTLASVRRSALARSGNRDVRQNSPLRKVSLTRLERQAQRLWAEGKRPDEAMQVLAGLTQIKYVLVYPESRDIVIAGPANDWSIDLHGRPVSVDAQRPTLRLDDLVVVLRNASADGGRFGCSITPRAESLASVQDFLAASAEKPLKPGERDRWLQELRERLGPQDISVFGIDPRTNAARVLVEADYHMKLVGMGLEPGTVGVTSYLDRISVPPGGSPPPMDVLRWWFTLNYGGLKTIDSRDVFELVGPGVKVLSENELLAERGQRVHTGKVSHHNLQFTQSFTKHFADLAVKYPIYAELRNLFDLAVVAALVHEEGLDSRCQWHQTFFGSQGKFQVELGTAPTQVQSVVNHRLIDRRHLVVGVSGGVSVDTKSVVRPATMQADQYGLLKADLAGSVPPALSLEAWWWD